MRYLKEFDNEPCWRYYSKNTMKSEDVAMDWGMTIASISVDLILTVFGYLLVPTILVVTGKKYETRKLKRINIINCIVVWILFRVLQVALGNEPTSGAAVILWGGVGHWLLQKYCLKDNESITDLQTQSTRPQTDVAKKTARYCSRCGNPIDPITKKCKGCGKQYFKGISWRMILVTLGILIVLTSVAGNVFLYLSNTNMQERIQTLEEEKTVLTEESKNRVFTIIDLETEVNQLKNKVDSLTEEISFYDEHIVFIEDDGTNLYHHYDCYAFVGNSFWAYNTEAAEGKGYKPCPLCCD